MSQTLRPKILILGGGIQGTCLLQAFSSGPNSLSTVLLETESIGSGQTRHSQAYIHEGFLYFQRNGYDNWRWWFAPAAKQWESLHQNDRKLVSKETFVTFRTRAEYDNTVAAFFPQSPPKHELPACPLSEHIKYGFKSNEAVLNVEKLLVRWRRAHRHRIVLAGNLEVSLRNGRPLVKAIVPDQGEIRFEPDRLLLAAGESNAVFLGQLGAPTTDIQHVKHARMLVISGSAAVLPELNTVVRDHNGAFVVTKPGPRGRHYWLFSNDASWNNIGVEAWVQGAVEDIREIAPSIFAKRKQLKWGTFTVRLVRGHLKSTEPIEGGRVYKCANETVLAVWPDRLTFGPFLAKSVRDQLAFDLGGPEAFSMPSWSASSRCSVAHGLWRTTGDEWEKFRMSNRLPPTPSTTRLP